MRWRRARQYKRAQAAQRIAQARRMSSREINLAANAYLPPIDFGCPACVLVPVRRDDRIRHERIACAEHAGELFGRLEQELGA